MHSKDTTFTTPASDICDDKSDQNASSHRKGRAITSHFIILLAH